MEGVRTITCSDGGWSNRKPSCKGKFYMLSERAKFFFSFSITKTIPGHQISDSDFIGFAQFTRNYINYVTLKREKYITVNSQNKMYSVTKAA